MDVDWENKKKTHSIEETAKPGMKTIDSSHLVQPLARLVSRKRTRSWFNRVVSVNMREARSEPKRTSCMQQDQPSSTNAYFQLQSSKGQREKIKNYKWREIESCGFFIKNSWTFFPLTCWRDIMKSSFLKREGWGKDDEEEKSERDRLGHFFSQTSIYDR